MLLTLIYLIQYKSATLECVLPYGVKKSKNMFCSIDATPALFYNTHTSQ